MALMCFLPGLCCAVKALRVWWLGSCPSSIHPPTQQCIPSAKGRSDSRSMAQTELLTPDFSRDPFPSPPMLPEPHPQSTLGGLCHSCHLGDPQRAV